MSKFPSSMGFLIKSSSGKEDDRDRKSLNTRTILFSCELKDRRTNYVYLSVTKIGLAYDEAGTNTDVKKIVTSLISGVETCKSDTVYCIITLNAHVGFAGVSLLKSGNIFIIDLNKSLGIPAHVMNRSDMVILTWSIELAQMPNCEPIN